MADYAVVGFTDEDDAVALVSVTWIEKEGGEQYSYWPLHRQSMKAKRHDIPDKETWGRHRIRVIKVTGNYEKAQSIVRKSEYTSNIDSEDDVQQRKRRPPQRLSPSPKTFNTPSDSGSDADLESVQGEPYIRRSPRKAVEIPMPILTTTKSKSTKAPTRLNLLLSSPSNQPSTSATSKSTKAPTTSNFPLASSPSNQPSTSARARASESNFQVQVLCTLQKLEEGQRHLMQLVQRLLMKSGVAVEAEDLREPFSDPLNSEEEFDALAAELGDLDFKKKMIRFLSLVGGSDVSQTARRMMKKLGTNYLWSNFNVLGRKGKRGLKTSAFFPVIIRSCVKNHPSAKESVIEEVIGDYLKRTPYLPGGRKSKKLDMDPAPAAQAAPDTVEIVAANEGEDSTKDD